MDRWVCVCVYPELHIATPINRPKDVQGCPAAPEFSFTAFLALCAMKAECMRMRPLALPGPLCGARVGPCFQCVLCTGALRWGLGGHVPCSATPPFLKHHQTGPDQNKVLSWTEILFCPEEHLTEG